MWKDNKGQGAQKSPKSSVRKKRGLKQLKVAISTPASLPRGHKSTKFMKQILSTYPRSFVISKLTKHATRKFVQTKTSQENFQFSDCHEILHAKREGGEGDVFSQEKHLYCLSYIQNFVENSLHSIKEPRIQYESSTIWLGSWPPFSVISLA
jgi:hypothetical protein